MPDKPPKGWVRTTLGEVNAPSRARALPSEAPGLPYVGMEHVEAQTMKLLGHGQASALKSSSVRFSKGDVLYGKMRPYLNKVWLAEFDGLCSAEFLVFPRTEGLSSQLFAYRLNAKDFVAFANQQVSGDRPRVDSKKLAKFPYLLPPTREQERIVTKLDALLSRVAAGEAAARRAQERLKRYRAAVLHAAVTGELTRDWRNSQLSTLTPQPRQRPAPSSSSACSRSAAPAGRKLNSNASTPPANLPETTSGRSATKRPPRLALIICRLCQEVGYGPRSIRSES
jgi:type I restriction enzyme, S subunit